MLRGAWKRPHEDEVSFTARKRAQEGAHGVVEPVIGPAVLRGNACHDGGEPIRPWTAYLGDIDILGRKTKVAGEHQRRATKHGDIQPGTSGDRGRADLVQRSKQLIAIERGHSRPTSSLSLAHRPKPASSARSSGSS